MDTAKAIKAILSFKKNDLFKFFMYTLDLILLLIFITEI